MSLVLEVPRLTPTVRSALNTVAAWLAARR